MSDKLGLTLILCGMIDLNAFPDSKIVIFRKTNSRVCKNLYPKFNLAELESTLTNTDYVSLERLLRENRYTFSLAPQEQAGKCEPLV